MQEKHEGFQPLAFFGCRKECFNEFCLEHSDKKTFWTRVTEAFDFKCTDGQQALYDKCFECKCKNNCSTVAQVKKEVHQNGMTPAVVRHLEEEMEGPVF